MTVRRFAGLALLLASACRVGAPPTVEAVEELVPCTDPRPEACTLEYRPVCALRDTGIRCVTTPCPSSEWVVASNACHACRDASVSGYVPGPCGDHPEP